MTERQIVNALTIDEIVETADKDNDGNFFAYKDGAKFYFTMKQLDSALVAGAMKNIKKMTPTEQKNLFGNL